MSGIKNLLILALAGASLLPALASLAPWLAARHFGLDGDSGSLAAGSPSARLLR